MNNPSLTLSIQDIQNTLFEGDCLEIMKQFPDNSIDMVLCDLPYARHKISGTLLLILMIYGNNIIGLSNLMVLLF